jgi:cytoskeletal protein RodZ
MYEKIGQELHQARQEQDIPLVQAAEETHIRLHYLEAMEEGDFGQLPSKAHERGFLRAYADYLGITPESLLSDLDDPEIKPEEIVIAAPVEQSSPTGEDANSVLIFRELGEELRQQREMLGFSLEEVERNIHIRLHYLEALESGDLDDLPSPVQGRGMLKNYASFLGMDVEPVLLQIADGLLAQHAEKRDARPSSPVTNTDIRRSRVSFIRSFLWGVIRINSFQATPEIVETVPSIAEALQSTTEDASAEIIPPTETPLTESVEGDAPAEIIPPPPAEVPEETPIPTVSNAPVQVYVSVLRRAWMRVTVDENVEFEGRVIPGSAYSFSGDFQIEIISGNGAAIQVFYNEADLGVMGVYGEVVYRVFTPDGELLPTPTATPIPTDTPEASPTLQPTNAP